MTETVQLKVYNKAVQGWLKGTLQEKDIDLLVRTNWLTKEQGEEIKAMPRPKIET